MNEVEQIEIDFDALEAAETMVYPYKFKLHPNRTQLRMLQKCAGACRFVYNIALQQRRMCREELLPTLTEIHESRQKGFDFKEYNKLIDSKAYRDNHKILHKISYQKQSPEFTQLRKTVDWLQEIPFSPVQETLRVLNVAFQNFFRAGGNAFPNFRNKTVSKIPFKPGEIKIKSFSKHVGGDGGRYSKIAIPRMTGLVSMTQDREIVGVIKTTTIKLENGEWYVVFLTEQPAKSKKKRIGTVGVDLGVKHIAITSDGEFYPTDGVQKKLYENVKKHTKKLKREQQRMAKMCKFSNNWKKQKSAINKLHKRISDSRNELQHEISNAIVNKYNSVVLEDLRLKNMTKSAAGDIENPGTNVAQKRGLNRSLLEFGLSELKRKIEYKIDWYGGDLTLVDPKFTSQRCSECGHTEKKNRKSQSEFKCRKCGHTMNADVNAAINIKMRA